MFVDFKMYFEFSPFLRPDRTALGAKFLLQSVMSTSSSLWIKVGNYKPASHLHFFDENIFFFKIQQKKLFFLQNCIENWIPL